MKVLPKHVPQPEVVHNLDEDAERLLLRHLQQERGDEEALALAVPDLAVVHRVRLRYPVNKVVNWLDDLSDQFRRKKLS